MWAEDAWLQCRGPTFWVVLVYSWTTRVWCVGGFLPAITWTLTVLCSALYPARQISAGQRDAVSPWRWNSPALWLALPRVAVGERGRSGVVWEFLCLPGGRWGNDDQERWLWAAATWRLYRPPWTCSNTPDGVCRQPSSWYWGLTTNSPSPTWVSHRQTWCAGHVPAGYTVWGCLVIYLVSVCAAGQWSVWYRSVLPTMWSLPIRTCCWLTVDCYRFLNHILE